MNSDNLIEDSRNVRSVRDTFPQILVVADEKTNVIIKEYLALEPYHTQCVTSSQEALKRIQQQAPVLLLCDIKLSQEGGYRVYQELDNNNISNIPTIMFVDRNQVNDLIYNSEAWRIDYLNKPFTKQEILVKIRTHIAVLSATHRLTRLRAFADQIVRINDLEALMYRAFTYLQEEPCLTDVTLFRGDNVCYSSGGDKSVLKDIYIQAKCAAHTGFCYTLRKGEFYYLIISLTDVKTWTFVMRIKSTSFSDIEKEYIQNVIHQVIIIKDNLYSVLCDPGAITNLYSIVSKMDQILFVKSAKQYVELHAKKHRPELLAISLKMVSLYLKDHLLKVHRSYLINPKEIVKVRRKKQGRYEILMKDHVIPIGEVYLPVFREKYSNLF